MMYLPPGGLDLQTCICRLWTIKAINVPENTKVQLVKNIFYDLLLRNDLFEWFPADYFLFYERYKLFQVHCAEVSFGLSAYRNLAFSSLLLT